MSFALEDARPLIGKRYLSNAFFQCVRQSGTYGVDSQATDANASSWQAPSHYTAPIALHQVPGSASIGYAIVKTPQQLLDAVVAGIRHIEIQDHLDMTTVAPLDTEYQDMMEPTQATWSIRVRHTALTLSCAIISTIIHGLVVFDMQSRATGRHLL